MPRTVVPLVTGEIYHIFNRGVDKRVIFMDKEDYLRLYQCLRYFNTKEPVVNFSVARVHKESNQPLVAIHAYSLLPNHLHLLIEQKEDGGVSEFMKRVLGGYTSYFNERHLRSGALFQGTFKRVHVESDEQYQYLFAYVNENHIVHGIQRPSEIMYSSSLHHQGVQKSTIVAEGLPYTTYDFTSQSALAKNVFERRATEKRMLHEAD